MMWIDIGVILFLTLRTTLFKPDPPRPLEPGDEASPAARGNEESVVCQGGVDDSLLFAEASNSKTKIAAITYLCNAEF
jgi:hypothetical protein